MTNLLGLTNLCLKYPQTDVYNAMRLVEASIQYSGGDVEILSDYITQHGKNISSELIEQVLKYNNIELNEGAKKYMGVDIYKNPNGSYSVPELGIYNIEGRNNLKYAIQNKLKSKKRVNSENHDIVIDNIFDVLVENQEDFYEYVLNEMTEDDYKNLGGESFVEFILTIAETLENELDFPQSLINEGYYFDEGIGNIVRKAYELAGDGYLRHQAAHSKLADKIDSVVNKDYKTSAANAIQNTMQSGERLASNAVNALERGTRRHDAANAKLGEKIASLGDKDKIKSAVRGVNHVAGSINNLADKFARGAEVGVKTAAKLSGGNRPKSNRIPQSKTVDDLVDHATKNKKSSNNGQKALSQMSYGEKSKAYGDLIKNMRKEDYEYLSEWLVEYGVFDYIEDAYDYIINEMTESDYDIVLETMLYIDDDECSDYFLTESYDYVENFLLKKFDSEDVLNEFNSVDVNPRKNNRYGDKDSLPLNLSSKFPSNKPFSSIGGVDKQPYKRTKVDLKSKTDAQKAGLNILPRQQEPVSFKNKTAKQAGLNIKTRDDYDKKVKQNVKAGQLKANEANRLKSVGWDVPKNNDRPKSSSYEKTPKPALTGSKADRLHAQAVAFASKYGDSGDDKDYRKGMAISKRYRYLKYGEKESKPETQYTKTSKIDGLKFPKFDTKYPKLGFENTRKEKNNARDSRMHGTNLSIKRKFVDSKENLQKTFSKLDTYKRAKEYNKYVFDPEKGSNHLKDSDVNNKYEKNRMQLPSSQLKKANDDYNRRNNIENTPPPSRSKSNTPPPPSSPPSKSTYKPVPQPIKTPSTKPNYSSKTTFSRNVPAYKGFTPSTSTSLYSGGANYNIGQQISDKYEKTIKSDSKPDFITKLNDYDRLKRLKAVQDVYGARVKSGMLAGKQFEKEQRISNRAKSMYDNIANKNSLSVVKPNDKSKVTNSAYDYRQRVNKTKVKNTITELPKKPSLTDKIKSKVKNGVKKLAGNQISRLHKWVNESVILDIVDWLYENQIFEYEHELVEYLLYDINWNDYNFITEKMINDDFEYLVDCMINNDEDASELLHESLGDDYFEELVYIIG